MAARNLMTFDGAKLKMYLLGAGKTMEELSLEIGAGKGYVSKVVLESRINPVHYKMICLTLGVSESQFKKTEPVSRPETPQALEAAAGDNNTAVVDMLKRIEKDIVRLGQIALDIRGILKEVR